MKVKLGIKHVLCIIPITKYKEDKSVHTIYINTKSLSTIECNEAFMEVRLVMGDNKTNLIKTNAVCNFSLLSVYSSGKGEMLTLTFHRLVG